MTGIDLTIAFLLLLVAALGLLYLRNATAALAVFAVTLFVSAFILFLVQPMVGKIILPKLGGTPQVWNTCMVFFQTVLLAGYGYTHTASTRLTPRMQLILHVSLLVVPILVMLPVPFWYADQWTPPTEENPIWQTLLLLLIIVGLPFFLVSTSAPLLQKWFVYTGDPAAKDPYFLYGASNLGSLLSLLSYPFIIEPLLPLVGQRYIFLIGYVLLGLLILGCAAWLWRMPSLHLAGVGEETLGSSTPDETPPATAPQTQTPAPPAAASTAAKSGPAPGAPRGIARKKGLKVPTGPASAVFHATEAPTHHAEPRPRAMTLLRRIRWVALAAVPTSLMLGVTSYVSVDLSPFPLLWIVPLALYLLSFILVFMPWWTTTTAEQHARGVTFTPHSLILHFFMPLGLVAIMVVLLRGGFDPLLSTLATMFGFFTVALGCHGELAHDRPPTRYLTEFYLLMSFGGMLGGVFNGIIAPLVFPGVWEFPIAIVAAALVRPALRPGGWLDDLLLDSFPGLKSWASDQSDELSKAMNEPAEGTPWLFHVILDVLLALFVGVLAYVTKAYIENIYSFLGMRSWPAADYLPLLVMYGIPLLFCFFFAGRPLRFGLAVIGVLFAQYYMLGDRDRGHTLLYGGRTYFGVLKVYRSSQGIHDPEEAQRFTAGPFDYTYLLHGTTHHGLNFIPDSRTKVDLSRLATTYYHRYGPVGVVMERYNWFPGPQNTFAADARLPASLVGMCAQMAGAGNLIGGVAVPYEALADIWSEPPYATIGLGTGTMASYGRPFQHVVYYEIDEKIRNFSLSIPENNDGRPYFTYLLGALRRGVDLEIVMGDARLSMARQHQLAEVADPSKVAPIDGLVPFLEPASKKEADEPLSTRKVRIQIEKSKIPQVREKYYKAIVVDAFSSDAIPVHLITKEAIGLYLDLLADDGVLCVHTSNRHLNLVAPVARIVNDAFPGYRVIVGKDGDRYERDERGRARISRKLVATGHFSSEYVMIFKDTNETAARAMSPDVTKMKQYSYLTGTTEIAVSRDNTITQRRSDVEWYDPIEKNRMTRTIWTDNYSNIVGVIRWPWPFNRHDFD